MVEGLVVALGGMGIVFLSLILLLFIIMGLERLFRVKEPVAEAEVEARPEAPPTVDSRVVAAISVAMARLSQEGLLIEPRRASRQVVAAISAVLARLPGGVASGVRPGYAGAAPDSATAAAISAALAQMQPGISIMESKAAPTQATRRAPRSSAWTNFGRQQLMSRARERHR